MCVQHKSIPNKLSDRLFKSVRLLTAVGTTITININSYEFHCNWISISIAIIPNCEISDLHCKWHGGLHTQFLIVWHEMATALIMEMTLSLHSSVAICTLVPTCWLTVRTSFRKLIPSNFGGCARALVAVQCLERRRRRLWDCIKYYSS